MQVNITNLLIKKEKMESNKMLCKKKNNPQNKKKRLEDRDRIREQGYQIENSSKYDRY